MPAILHLLYHCWSQDPVTFDKVCIWAASLVPRPSEEGLVHTVVRMRVNLTNFWLKPEILLFLRVTITFEFHKLQVTIDN